MPSSPQQSLPILVVDDNPGDQQLTAIHLGEIWPFEQDLELDFAAAGEEAIHKLRIKSYALVILDWRMPGLNGRDVLLNLRQSGCRLPVVVLSGVQREDIEANLDELGAVYLHKDRLNANTFHRVIVEAVKRGGCIASPTTMAAAAPAE